MKPEPSGYLAVESLPPFKGLLTALPSTQIPPEYSPKLLNVTVRDGVVRRKADGQQLGQRLLGSVMAMLEFGPIGENPFFVVLTSRRQYVYDETTNLFTDLTDGQVDYDLTGGDTPTNTMWVGGDQTAIFVTGLVFPVVAGGVNTGIYTVVTSTFFGGNTLIEVEETIPNTAILAGTGHITLADELTTEGTDFIDYAAVTDLTSHRLLMTNGRDTPLVWDGDITHMFETWTPNYPDFITCKTFCVFGEHLFMGNIESGSVEPQLIAWSDAGDFDEFNSANGTDGAQLLYQLGTGIVSMKVLGDRMGIYSQDEIMTAVAVGPPAIFAFEVVIPAGTRLVGHNAIVSINVGHIYVSDESFYLFDGTRGLRPLGEGAVDLDYKEVKDPENLYKVAALNDYSKHTLYFAIPDADGETTIYTIFYNIFNLGSIRWAKEKYHDNVTAWGFYISRELTITWEDTAIEHTAFPSGEPWSEEIGNWFEEGEQVGFPARCYGTDTGYVVLANETKLSDRGFVSQYQIYETKDFELDGVNQSLLVRWGEIEFEAWGQQVNVIVSTDKGRSYRGIETVVLNDQRQSFRLPIDFMSRTIRVKFITSGSDYSIGWVRLWGRPGGPA